MTTSAAKKIVKTWLIANGFDCKVTARTVDFTDLARCSAIFVRVHNWPGSSSWTALKALAVANGFHVEAY